MTDGEFITNIYAARNDLREAAPSWGSGSSPEDDPAWLLGHSRNDYSQAGEDGIIDKILCMLPPVEHRWCVEFGAWDGAYLSNTALLIEKKGYAAVLIEADMGRYEALVKKFAGNPKIHWTRRLRWTSGLP